MNRIAAVCGVLALVSCGSTGPVLFTGQEIMNPRGISINPLKEKDRITVVLGEHPIGMNLPYAEDWSFEGGAAKPLYGRTKSREVIVSILRGELKPRVKEDEHLQGVLSRIREKMEPAGVPINDAQIVELAGHFVLGYKNDLPAEMKAQPQLHFWAVRQTEQGQIYEAHISTTVQGEDQRKNLAMLIVKILAAEIRILT